jgi:CDP-glucose 4,6-dehydratase
MHHGNAGNSMSNDFWLNKKVFITGHTGFKGSWLCLWLNKLGANVKGYSLKAETSPNLFSLFEKHININNVVGDVRDIENLKTEVNSFSPDIIIHLAAQAIVRTSYQDPVDTFSTNVMGTVNLFEAAKSCPSVKVILNITTDKCYKNNEWLWGYKETDPLGGDDPYSSSKACAELVSNAYATSFFKHGSHGSTQANVATARAGNVIGGGDWACDRLMTDIIHAIINDKTITLRNPSATRPWQHVFDAISGYLILIEHLYIDGSKFSGGWNFGPLQSGEKNVEWIVKKILQVWGSDKKYTVENIDSPHEAHFLKLDCSKANLLLKWSPTWDLGEALPDIVAWYKKFANDPDTIFKYSEQSLEKYLSDKESKCPLN